MGTSVAAASDCLDFVVSAAEDVAAIEQAAERATTVDEQLTSERRRLVRELLHLYRDVWSVLQTSSG